MLRFGAFSTHGDDALETLITKREGKMKMQKNECSCDTVKPIKGVMCDVRNCAYHSGANECHAGCICVGPHEANCSANTSCATFKPKEC